MPATGSSIRAVLLDFGDTLADQGSERRDAAGFMFHVDLIPGARELLVALRDRGHPLALVVDGEVAENAAARAVHGLDGLFDAIAISEEVGVSKPDPRIFEVALERLGLDPSAEPGRVVMVGNRLERDVKGAARLGIRTVWLDWAPRYRKEPKEPDEIPDHTISAPLELLGVLDEISSEPRE
jgi:putative hydrolase of the HAD superfamily